MWFQAFDTEYELESESIRLRKNDSNSAFLAGVVFVDFSSDNSTVRVPPLTRYKIRMDKDDGPDPNELYNKFIKEGVQKPSKWYTSGFQYLQVHFCNYFDIDKPVNDT